MLADIFKDVGTIVFATVVVGNFVPGFKEDVDVPRMIWGLAAVMTFWFTSYFFRPEGGGRDG